MYFLCLFFCCCCCCCCCCCMPWKSNPSDSYRLPFIHFFFHLFIPLLIHSFISLVHKFNLVISVACSYLLACWALFFSEAHATIWHNNFHAEQYPPSVVDRSSDKFVASKYLRTVTGRHTYIELVACSLYITHSTKAIIIIVSGLSTGDRKSDF